MQYCTILEVKEVAKLAGQDFNEISESNDAEISAAIDEATSSANDLLQTRYSIATIESSVPLDVNSFTKIKAAAIIMDRFGVASSTMTKEYVTRQKEQLHFYKRMFLMGNVRDLTGALIPTDNRAVFTPSASNTGITDLYN